MALDDSLEQEESDFKGRIQEVRNVGPTRYRWILMSGSWVI